MGHRLQQRFRKLNFIMRKKKWRQQIVDLGRQIDRVAKLFGEAEALAPARQSRGSVTHQAFGQVRSQASSLHKAIIKALACACDTPHTIKLVTAKRPKAPSSRQGPSPPGRTLKVSFPLCPRLWTMARTVLEKEDAWCSFDTTMVSPPEIRRPSFAGSDARKSQTSISSGSRVAGQGGLLSPGSASTRTDTTTPLSSTSSCERTTTLFGTSPSQSGEPPKSSSPLPELPDTAHLIEDLCGAIRTGKGNAYSGYLNDGVSQRRARFISRLHHGPSIFFHFGRDRSCHQPQGHSS